MDCLDIYVVLGRMTMHHYWYIIDRYCNNESCLTNINK